MIQPCIYRPFVDLPVWWTPFRIRHFDPQITKFQRNCPQVWQTTVDLLCMPMPSYIQCGWMTEVRARTGNIKSIYLLVACLQGSDAGQKCFKILRIFNFGVQLRLTRIRFRSCNCRGRSAQTYWNRPWMIQPCIYRPFVDLPVWWTPFRIRHFEP